MIDSSPISPAVPTASQPPVSLGTRLVQAVQKEAAMQSPLPICAIVHEDGAKGARIGASVTLVDNDRFSHLAEEVTISVTRAKTHGPKIKPITPQATAEKFAARVTYLTENLQFVEGDASGAAILRSTPQTMRAKGAEYFEARVTESNLSLKRFQPHDAKPGRAAIPFSLTDEVLARLADDAAASLGA